MKTEPGAPERLHERLPERLPERLIEAYVADVIRGLPLRQRKDVGAELRALLIEELRGRVSDEGRLPDEAMALDLVRAFGAPADVAARYHAPGVAIIPSGHTAGFGWTAFIGVALQWAITLPAAIGAGGAAAIGGWWISYGLGALWWPGFMVMALLAAALVRQRWPAPETPWRPSVLHRDEINRPLHAAGILAALCGIAIWVWVAWFQSVSTSPVAKALAFDPAFFAIRAPALLVYWAAGLVLMAVVLAEGRWRTFTRRLNLAHALLGAALMTWFVLAGPIFAGEPADRTARAALLVIVAAVLVDVGWKLWRRRPVARMPDGAAAPH